MDNLTCGNCGSYAALPMLLGSDNMPCVLTADHAASCYGQPVLVLPDGSAISFAEALCRPGVESLCWGTSTGARLPACGGMGGLDHGEVMSLLRRWGVPPGTIVQHAEEYDGGGTCYWIEVAQVRAAIAKAEGAE